MKTFTYKPELLLQKLVQYKTISPQGNEQAAMLFLKELFEEHGFETKLFALDVNRPNLLVTLKGKNRDNPFLMYGHIDVVDVTNQEWDFDPFSGEIADGYVHGRGTLDMKGFLVMYACVLLQMKAEKIVPNQDIKLLFLSDEESTGKYGAEFIVNNHADEFAGVKYAFGESGGFPMWIENKKLFPIMVAEKQAGTVMVSVKSSGGHGSFKTTDNSAVKLSEAIVKLNNLKMPHTVTKEVAIMIRAMAKEVGGFKGFVIKQLLNKHLAKTVIKLMGDNGKFFDVLLYNSFNVTVVEAGNNFNVIPSLAKAYLDVRLLPNETIDNFIKYLKQNIPELEYEVINFNGNNQTLDMKHYDKLATIIKNKVSDARPIPYVLTAVTDGRFLSRLNIQTYGYTPMNYERDFNFIPLVHNANEKINIDSLYFGIECIKEFIIDFE